MYACIKSSVYIYGTQVTLCMCVDGCGFALVNAISFYVILSIRLCTLFHLILLYFATEVSIGFMDSAIVVSEPTNFTVSVVLFQNNLDPGSEISLNLMGRDGVATGIVSSMCIGPGSVIQPCSVMNQ